MELIFIALLSTTYYYLTLGNIKKFPIPSPIWTLNITDKLWFKSFQFTLPVLTCSYELL